MLSDQKLESDHLLPLDAYCAVTNSKNQSTHSLYEQQISESVKKIKEEDYDCNDHYDCNCNANNCGESRKIEKKSLKRKYVAQNLSSNNKAEQVQESNNLKETIKIEPPNKIMQQRTFEEGEIPEDVETLASIQHNSYVQLQKPIDFTDFNRKRKVALLLSYCGAGYHGMQKNPDVETIELKLLEALTAINAIREEHKTDYLVKNQNSLNFQRSARTDKGVSAARQVVSLKIIAKESFLEDVNKNLPSTIQVFGIERVTKKFDAKCLCSGRSYEYIVPSFAFAPSKDNMDSSYRLPDAQLEKVNRLLGAYVGTHNFHNFTSGKRFGDKSATRYITVFTASSPFETRGHEFVTLEVSGQSFMIHQIRKMIGLCMAICRGYCSEDLLEKCWGAAKLDIPKAPGLGLLLNRVYFEQYNKKVMAEGERNPLTFDDAELPVGKFKIEKIWHSIIEEEIKKSSIVQWLKTLPNHTYTAAGMIAPLGNNYKGEQGVFPPNKR